MLLADLLPLLACPCDEHGSLKLRRQNDLKATCCGRIYPVVDGIPVLLMSQARKAKG
jgi:hypothetical protein